MWRFISPCSAWTSGLCSPWSHLSHSTGMVLLWACWVGVALIGSLPLPRLWHGSVSYRVDGVQWPRGGRQHMPQAPAGTRGVPRWDSGCPPLGGTHFCCKGSSFRYIYGMGNGLRVDSSVLDAVSQALTATRGTEQKELVWKGPSFYISGAFIVEW